MSRCRCGFVHCIFLAAVGEVLVHCMLGAAVGEGLVKCM